MSRPEGRCLRVEVEDALNVNDALCCQEFGMADAPPQRVPSYSIYSWSAPLFLHRISEVGSSRNQAVIGWVREMILGAKKS